jgi:RNA polymerase sigma-70 factor (ECF subfamily)
MTGCDGERAWFPPAEISPAPVNAPLDNDDRHVMRRVQAGEVDRFTELVARYRVPLLRVAAGRLGRTDWAEEAVQEAFLAAFRSRDTYDAERSFRTWLWTILLNQCRAIGLRRDRAGQVGCWSDRAPDASIDATVCCDRPSPLGELLARERAETLERLLQRLSPAQADALRLRFFGELKFQEIAETMGCSLLTAKNRVKWGLLRLAELAREASPTPAPTNTPDSRPASAPGGEA